MYIAIDIGGTNIRVGASKNGRTFFAIEKCKTPKKFEEGVRDIKRTVLRISGGPSSVHQIGVAVPDPKIDHARGRLSHLPNLQGWSNKPLAKALEEKLHTKVRLVNDADAAGIGEARYGAGRKYQDVLYYTVSTGIGGAHIVRGAIDQGSSTWNGEPGHFTLIPNGRKCGCGRRGCFEAYASGTGFYITYGMRTEDCKDQTIWNEYAQTLGQGILKTLPRPLPDVIVIGGGVSRVSARLFKPLRAYIKKNLRTSKLLPIVPAKLGDNAGLYGCLTLLKTHQKFLK